MDARSVFDFSIRPDGKPQFKFENKKEANDFFDQVAEVRQSVPESIQRIFDELTLNDSTVMMGIELYNLFYPGCLRTDLLKKLDREKGIITIPFGKSFADYDQPIDYLLARFCKVQLQTMHVNFTDQLVTEHDMAAQTFSQGWVFEIKEDIDFFIKKLEIAKRLKNLPAYCAFQNAVNQFSASSSAAGMYSSSVTGRFIKLTDIPEEEKEERTQIQSYMYYQSIDIDYPKNELTLGSCTAMFLKNKQLPTEQAKKADEVIAEKLKELLKKYPPVNNIQQEETVTVKPRQ